MDGVLNNKNNIWFIDYYCRGNKLSILLCPDDVNTIKEDMTEYPNMTYHNERVTFNFIYRVNVNKDGGVESIEMAELSDPFGDYNKPNKCSFSI